MSHLLVGRFCRVLQVRQIYRVLPCVLDLRGLLMDRVDPKMSEKDRNEVCNITNGKHVLVLF